MDRTSNEVAARTKSQQENAIVRAYLCAKLDVLKSQYAPELLSAKPSPYEISESFFLRELAWVILAGGMSERVIRSKFPQISTSFLQWESADDISRNASKCIADAMLHFRHQGKITAIADAAHRLCLSTSFDSFRLEIIREPIQQLQCFAYIGPITAFHLAKNLGFSVAKPDRHLERLARRSGFDSVEEFCGLIASYLGEDLRLVDSVLWRFATMYEDYLNLFSSMMVDDRRAAVEMMARSSGSVSIFELLPDLFQ